ncbi:MAG TPA: hypothetical protein VKA62_00325, partial [Agromyces sp.]|nr:hypothetical protein [Agromyces sp.]
GDEAGADDKPAKKPAKKTAPVRAAAPKVNAETMREAPPLYVEPEERDEVTDAAAAITAAATASVPITPGGAEAEGKPGGAKKTGGGSEHLTLAERLGLRAPGGPREGDDDQEVGPTK